MQAKFLRWLPLGAGLATFAAYAWLAAPGLYWLDSQELGAAAVQLGIPHPTGFPLFCVIGRLLAWLPFGELAWRVHLGSAAGAAVAAGVVVRLVLELAGEDLAAGLAGIGAALVMCGSFTFYRAATVTEVYASMAGALAVGLWGLWRVARGAPAATGLSLAFFAGLAATGLHSSFALLLVPPFLVVYLWRLWRPRGTRWPRLAPALVLLGAAGVAAYMPVRSASGSVDVLDWDHPRTAVQLGNHLSAARIRAAFAHKMLHGGGSGAELAEVGQLADGDLGTLALLAAAGGALALALRRERWAAAALLVGIGAGDVVYAVFLNPMGVADRQTGVPLALAVAVLGGAGVAAASRILRRFAPFGAAALAAIIAVPALLGGMDERVALRTSEAPRAWAEAALDECPAGAIALTISDTLGAEFFWLTIAEPARPDAAHIIHQHLWDLARDRAVFRRVGMSLKAQNSQAAEYEILNGRRPVCVELSSDPLPRQATAGLPMGQVHVAPGKPLIADLDRIFLPETLGDEQTTHTASDAYNNAGVIAKAAGDPRRATALAERSAAIRPNLHAFLNAARARIDLGDNTGAKTDLDEAARLAPRDAELYALRAIVAMNEGRCDDARDLFESALRLNPRQRDAVPNVKRLPDCYARAR